MRRPRDARPVLEWPQDRSAGSASPYRQFYPIRVGFSTLSGGVAGFHDADSTSELSSWREITCSKSSSQLSRRLRRTGLPRSFQGCRGFTRLILIETATALFMPPNGNTVG